MAGGLFASPGTLLTGDPFTMVFVFNTSLGTTKTTSTPSTDLFGGTNYGVKSPALGVVVTINGRSAGICGKYIAELMGLNEGTVSEFTGRAYDVDVADFSTQSYAVFNVTSSAGMLPSSITTPFSHNVTGQDTSSGYVSFRIYDSGLKYYTVNAYANLNMSSITLSKVPSNYLFQFEKCHN
jgi:hypothetical protein